MSSEFERVDITYYASYRIPPEVLDQMPIGTFLIASEAVMHGSKPTAAMRLVKPREPSPYPPPKLTPGGRLLYYFWSRTEGGKKALGMASTVKTWRWIVQPGDPGFEELDAFKIACDHRRGKQVSTGLLSRALGWEPTDGPA